MTIFGKKLKSYIVNNEINVYKLAQKSGIERTAIYKIISMGRIPDIEYVQKLINAMSISPYEKEELWTAYNISKYGEFIYNQRLQVKNLIERMNTAFETTFPAIPPPDHLFPAQDTRVIHGELAVNKIVDDILTHEIYAENPQVYFFMPHDHEFFFESLFFKYRCNNALKIECLFEFSKSADISLEQRNDNLDVIGTLLPFIMRSHGNFDAYYLYSSSPLHDRTALPMPYYLITSQYIVTLTAHMQTAVLHTNPVVIDCYKKIFIEAKAKSNPLITNITSLAETIRYYSANTNVKSAGISGFGSHPCIAGFFDNEIIKKHLAIELPHRDMIVDTVKDIYAHMAETMSNGKSASYFTMEGFNIFVEQGYIETLSEQFFSPFSPEERAYMLNRMISAIESETIIYRLINTSKLKIPKCFYVDVFNGSHMNIVVGDRTGGEVNTVNISEENVVEAFHDFLISMAETDIVYSKKDMLQTLHNALTQLENGNMLV